MPNSCIAYSCCCTYCFCCILYWQHYLYLPVNQFRVHQLHRLATVYLHCIFLQIDKNKLCTLWEHLDNVISLYRTQIDLYLPCLHPWSATCNLHTTQIIICNLYYSRFTVMCRKADEDLGTNFVGARTRKISEGKIRQNSARFRTTLNFDQEYLRNGSR